MIETERLSLRRWRESDVELHYRLVRDPLVIATLGGPPPREVSEQVIVRQNALCEAMEFCIWAVEHRATGDFIGWCGLKPGPADTPIASETEIAWTLTPAYWHMGLAREAAAAVLAWAWASTDLTRIVATTTPGNSASWGLMERLGMLRVADGDFDHPGLPEGDPLRRHLTYAIERP